VHVVRVGEHAVEVAPGVAAVGAAPAAAGPHGLHRVRVDQPVGDVDDVAVLLDDDVAREDAVPDPVAEAQLGGGRIGDRRPPQRGGEVVDLARHEVANLPLANPLLQLDVRRRVANLEADRQALLTALHLLAERHHLLGAGHVHRHRLLEVDVLARGQRRLEVHRVEVRRGRDVDGVDVLRGEQLLVRLGAAEHPAGLDCRLAKLPRHLVERLLAVRQVVLEDVADGGDHGAGVLEERAGHAQAATAAPQQAQADGRVRLAAEHDARLQYGDGGRGGRAAHELAAADARIPGLTHCRASYMRNAD